MATSYDVWIYKKKMLMITMGFLLATERDKPYSTRAHNRFNQVVEAKRFEGVFFCRKVC